MAKASAKTTSKTTAQETVNPIVKNLNELLANYHIFYMNVRGYHWNVRGSDFFTLHLKFEELYTALQLQIDEIAERILMLRGKPLHAYSDFAKVAVLKEDKNKSDGKACVEGVLQGLTVLLEKERALIDLAEEAEDSATADQLIAYTQEQDKLVWMYNAYLG